MIKSRKIDSFYKRNVCDEDEKNAFTSSKLEKLHHNPKIKENEKQLYKVRKDTYNGFENTLERDLGKCPQIGQYPPNQIEVRMTYLKLSPYQMHLENHLLSSKDGLSKKILIHMI